MMSAAAINRDIPQLVLRVGPVQRDSPPVRGRQGGVGDRGSAHQPDRQTTRECSSDERMNVRPGQEEPPTPFSHRTLPCNLLRSATEWGAVGGE